MGAFLTALRAERPGARSVLDLDHDEMMALCDALGVSRTHADRIRAHLHRRGRLDPAVPGLPRRLLAVLARLDWSPPRIVADRRAADGSRKLLVALGDGAQVETVLLPIEGRLTQCISTQAGCALGCRFCRTATLGLRRHLAAGEMVAQLFAGWRATGEKPRNLVLMGMGEPLHNLEESIRFVRIAADPKGLAISPRRITVSTAGVVPGILRLAELDAPCHLAISLNAADDVTRSRLMPINRRWPIEALLDAARRYCAATGKGVLIEYVLLAGINDRDADAERLARLLTDLPCTINLLPFNPHPAAPFRRPSDARVDAFRAILRRAGYLAVVRASRGREIAAACGQLAANG